ncbi:MAG: hypothetical protein E7605_03750 [Ruminococcaceae bacterium]|nr:hypothetical protein [Oscillospiraceae bacterium]
MNETKKRIAEYKKKLPKLKEKVLATALLVILAFAMATTSTFAWLVLSRAPEVSGATTSLAANGNLEIALVGPEGKFPAESAVGDSNLDLILKNITWGNLINLSDPRYGLDNLVLRPAQLSTSTLQTEPLWGAEYKPDGRIEKLNTEFGYATWVEDPNVGGYFAITDDLGVRVISSVTQEFVGLDKTKKDMEALARATNIAATSRYTSIADEKNYMQSLATMMGLYMTARMNPSNAELSNPTFESSDVDNLAAMYEIFLEAFDLEAEAMAHLLNYQTFLITGNKTPVYTKDDIWNNDKLPVWEEADNSKEKGNLNKKVTNSEGNAKSLQLTALATFRKNRQTIQADLVKLKEIAEGKKGYKWQDSGMNNIVNNLVIVGDCTIGKDNTPISSIGASNAMGYLSGTQEARITNGILYNFEYRTGGYIEVKNLSISATVERKGITLPATVKANVQTTAPRDTNLFTEDLNYTTNVLGTGKIEGGEMVANDTYGLAVDLWVRTNAEGSFLTLGGNVLIETRTERATGKNADGDTVELFVVDVTFEITDENNETVSKTETYDLYQKGDAWYNADTHGEFVFEDYGLSENTQPRQKYEDVEYVVGYEGENRVWDGSYGLSVNSTTQGSGSCYVFYADTPEDQAKSLKLLAAMKIAFVNAESKKVATAIMDTEHFYAKEGKVIVPMVLDPSDSINLGEDIEGNLRYAIMPLQKNKATRLTAILYLDGTKLDNSQVLSAASIQGQLNVQFESSVNLNSVDNEELRVQELKVSAMLGKNSFNYDESSETNPMIPNVTITVEGDQPDTVSAFFIRKINDTQGSREETINFIYDAVSGTWKEPQDKKFAFTAPGNYVLRSVRLDGIEYDLDTPQTVTIEGFTLTSLDWGLATNSETFMTASSSVSTNMWLNFASNDVNKMPKTVHGRFIREGDGSVANVQFTYDSTTATWRGKVTFAMSGEYSLQYLVLDGEYQEIPESMRKYVSAKLGMRVMVYTTSPQSFKYLPSEMESNGTDRLHMQMVILDDEGNKLPGLEDVKLIYHMRGNSAKKMETDLNWTADSLQYTGSFDAVTAGAGIFEFLEVWVGKDVITNDLTSPIFTMISPDPPVFLNANGNATYVFATDGSAAMSVQMKHVSTADVLAKISDGTNEYWVKGTAYDDPNDDTETVSNVTFIIPNGLTVHGKQDGNWTLKEINVWNYYDAAGNGIFADITADSKGLVSEVVPGKDTSGKEFEPLTQALNVTMKVVATVKITFPSGQSQDFGKDESGKVTGAFMDSYNISGLNVTIADFENMAIEGVSEVTLKYTYKNDSLTYGGYSGVDNSKANFEIKLSGSGTTFAQATPYIIQYAGSWTVEFGFKVGGVSHTYSGTTLPNNTPNFTVSSVAPTVTITSANYASKSGGTSTITDGKSTTVYYKETTETNCGITYYNYTPGDVTITLSGYGKAASARMEFTTSNSDGKVHLYEESQKDDGTSTNKYTWSADGTCKRYMGHWESQTGTDKKTPAGTLTSTGIILSDGVNEFTVPVTIVINNPN